MSIEVMRTIYIYICIYICIYIYVYIYTYVHIYICRERQRAIRITNELEVQGLMSGKSGAGRR